MDTNSLSALNIQAKERGRKKTALVILQGAALSRSRLCNMSGNYFSSSPTYSSSSSSSPLAVTQTHTVHLVSLTPIALSLACSLAPPSLCYHSLYLTLDHPKLCPAYLKSTLMFETGRGGGGRGEMQTEGRGRRKRGGGGGGGSKVKRVM